MDEWVVPGEKLGNASAYAAGEGAYSLGGVIRASVVGKKVIVKRGSEQVCIHCVMSW
jgi:exosome complex RNA-binding protein Rrp4